ncbi:hypothetical protein NFI96_026766 [Prochilodus magdalenae]|nr:hypothetical protein NFI96_026766 [Prochilodus magdalenae]
MLPIGPCSQAAAHRPLPTDRCSEAAAQGALLRGCCPGGAVHRTLPIGGLSQKAAQRMLPTGRCPKGTAHRTLPRGCCPQDTAHRTLTTHTNTPPPRQCHCSAENDPPPTSYLLCGGPVGVLPIEEQGNTVHRETDGLQSGPVHLQSVLYVELIQWTHSFQVGQDSGRCVTCMVSYGQGVWVALQGSAQVRLYHSTTYESITEVDVAPAVHKMLAGSDAIIRQHKAACLRITALLACRDVLWIGTSAGVVLTLSIPPVSSNVGTGALRTPLLPMGSAHGHTGHVRFLTSIELPEGFDVSFPSQTEPANSAQSGSEVSSSVSVQRRDSTHRRASTLLQSKSSLLVISGGDGYEDFRLTSSSETVGRDDSTNHLLLWRV